MQPNSVADRPVRRGNSLSGVGRWRAALWFHHSRPSRNMPAARPRSGPSRRPHARPAAWIPAALALCAVLGVLPGGAGTAFAQTETTLWSDTLTVGASSTDSSLHPGYWVDSHGSLAGGDSQYFTIAGDSRAVTRVTNDNASGGTLRLRFTAIDDITEDPWLSAALRVGLTFHVGTATFDMSGGNFSDFATNFTWATSGLSWTVGDTYAIKITKAPVPTVTSATSTPVLIELVFDKNLDTDSVPAASAFTVGVTGGAPRPQSPGSVQVVIGPVQACTWISTRRSRPATR